MLVLILWVLDDELMNSHVDEDMETPSPPSLILMHF